MGRGSSGTNPYNSNQKGITIAVNTNNQRLGKAAMKVVAGGATSIKDMEHRDMQKEIQQAISRYEAVLGVRERKIMLAPLNGAYGVTYIGEDGSRGIYLNSKYFDVSKKEFEERYSKDNYARRGGFKNTTRKPAQHTVTHELTHSLWSSYYDTPKHKAAGAEIKKLYKEFQKDTSTVRKKNYGSYGNSSVDEFWAEVITRGIHGDNDRYTRKAIAIAKRYKL